MKNVLKLTADELLNVLEAAEVEACNRGWPVESAGEPENDVCADIFAIMDAGLSAMDIEIEEEIEAEDEDEDELEDYIEDEDEDDEDEESESDPIEDMIFLRDGKRCISSDNAQLLLMNMLSVVTEMYAELPREAQIDLAKNLLVEFSKERRIDWVAGE